MRLLIIITPGGVRIWQSDGVLYRHPANARYDNKQYYQSLTVQWQDGQQQTLTHDELWKRLEDKTQQVENLSFVPIHWLGKPNIFRWKRWEKPN